MFAATGAGREDFVVAVFEAVLVLDVLDDDLLVVLAAGLLVLLLVAGFVVDFEDSVFDSPAEAKLTRRPKATAAGKGMQTPEEALDGSAMPQETIAA